MTFGTVNRYSRCYLQVSMDATVPFLDQEYNYPMKVVRSTHDPLAVLNPKIPVEVCEVSH